MSHDHQKSAVIHLALLFVIMLVAITWPHATVAHSSEFCEVLNRFSAEKKIADPQIRARFEGEYGGATDTDRRRTWNVETVCDDFLVVVPLWADVSPPVLSQKGETLFEDYTGDTWDFEIGDDDSATGVTMTAPDGTVTEMKRLGDPRTFE